MARISRSAKIIKKSYAISNGLIGAWIGGSGIDTGSFKQHGTFGNSATTALSSKYGPVLDFTAGTTAHLNCGSDSITNPRNGISIFQLVYPVSYPAAENWTMARDSNSGGRSFAFGLWSSAGFNLQINGAGTWQAGAGSISLNAWNTIFMHGDAANGYNGYINAIWRASAAWTQPNATTNELYIGSRKYSGFESGINGYIAVSYLWDWAIPVDAITKLHNNPFMLVENYLKSSFESTDAPAPDAYQPRPGATMLDGVAMV